MLSSLAALLEPVLSLDWTDRYLYCFLLELKISNTSLQTTTRTEAYHSPASFITECRSRTM